MNESIIVTSDGQAYQDEFQLTMGRPMPDPWEQGKPEKNQPSEEKSPSNLSQDAAAVAAQRTKQSVQPEGGREEGGTTKVLAGYLEHALKQVGTMPQRTIEAADHFAKTGEYDPGPAVEAAMMLYGVNAPFIKPGTVGIFGGRGAYSGSFSTEGTAAWAKNTKSYETAKILDSMEVDPNFIHEATGWFKDLKDKRWKFEIDDSKATVSEDIFSGMVLQDALNHPKLYQAYPELKTVKLEIHPDNPSYGGYADWYNNKLVVTDSVVKNPDLLKNVILHEAQHFVQNTEGFAAGAAPERNIQKIVTKFDEDMPAINMKADIYANQITRMAEEKGLGNVDKDLLTEYKRLLRIQQTYLRLKETALDVANENYRKTAGEVESRNVEYRAGWSERDRAEGGLPYKTEDVPVEEQLISKKVQRYRPFGDNDLGR